MNDLPSIAFLVDEPGWAFDRWTAALAEALGRIGLRATTYFRKTLPQHIEGDFVYVCWWPDVELVAPRLTHSQHILCRVTDMVTWNRHAPDDWQARFKQLVPLVHTYVASSQQVEHELHVLGRRNVLRLGDCVDTSRFRGKRFRSASKPAVGWCGNPKALEWMGFVDLKGLSIVESLRAVSEVTLKVAFGLPPWQMPRWYRSIDIYVCASRLEGTPLPVLEAMATGNLVISTSVGIVPELRSPGLFLFDGTPSGLHEAIASVIRVRSQWAHFGAMNRQCVTERWSSTAAANALSTWLSASARSLREEVDRADR